MADIKFSELPKATTSKDSDEIAILQDGVNKMIQSPVLESKIINKTVSRVIEQGGASLNLINIIGVVPTYADLATITPTPELNDAYQVEADGLVYVYTESGFQADGDGFNVQPEPIGVVEEGNPNAVSGGEVFKSNQYLGILTHVKNDTNSNVNYWLNFISEIYIIDTEQLNNSKDYGINNVWINSSVLGANVSKFGLQIFVNNSLYSNFGLPNTTDNSVFYSNSLVELKSENSEQPLNNRIKVYVKFKGVLPTQSFTTQKTINPFYNSAFLFKKVSDIVDNVRPSSTINKITSTDNNGIWMSVIKNIYIDDVNYKSTDKYGVNYIWLNHTLGKWGFQLFKNGASPTNYRVTEALQANKIVLLSNEGDGALKDTIRVVVETEDFTSFPTASFLANLPTSLSDVFFNKNVNDFQKVNNVLNLFNQAKKRSVIVTKEANGNNGIQLAINSITNATEKDPVTIRVKKGIYKAENSTDFTANGDYPAFILPKDNINIVGDSKEDCIIWAELPYNNASINRAIARDRHQTVYSWADNSKFENITFVGKNIRYTLHQDNPNEANKKRYYKNCDWKFLGDKGFLSTMGIGTYSGSETYVEGGSTFSEYLYPVAIHNNQVFENPSIWSFKGHIFRSLTVDCLAMQNSGSLISDQLILENTRFDGGFKLKYLEWYIYTPNYNDSYNHANWQIRGFGNSPMCFENNVLGKGLKVESNANAGTVRFDVSSSAYPLIIANNKTYFGNLGHPERKIQDKYIIHDFMSEFPSYAIGAMSIQEDNYMNGTTTSQDRLGLRLGDCSAVNKTLGIIINNITYNIVFDKDYTSFTNAQIIAEINAVLDGVGTASEYIIGRDYYPEFTDVNFVLRNNSSEPILKGTLVSRVGTGVKKSTTGDIVLGIAIDDIEPSWKTGEGVYYGFGRIIKKMIFHTNQVLKESGVAIEKNKKYSAFNGKLIEDINGNLIGYDNDYLLIN